MNTHEFRHNSINVRLRYKLKVSPIIRTLHRFHFMPTMDMEFLNFSDSFTKTKKMSIQYLFSEDRIQAYVVEMFYNNYVASGKWSDGGAMNLLTRCYADKDLSVMLYENRNAVKYNAYGDLPQHRITG